jgi:hypothetical protein
MGEMGETGWVGEMVGMERDEMGKVRGMGALLKELNLFLPVCLPPYFPYFAYYSISLLISFSGLA